MPLYVTHQRRNLTCGRRLFLPLCIISHLKKGRDLQLLSSMFFVAIQRACCQQLSLQYCLSARAHSPNSQHASIFSIEPNCIEEELCASPELNTELINKSVVAKPFETEKCSKSYILLLLNTSLLALELQSISLNVEGRG